jgi:hypothetical protein
MFMPLFINFIYWIIIVELTNPVNINHKNKNVTKRMF